MTIRLNILVMVADCLHLRLQRLLQSPELEHFFAARLQEVIGTCTIDYLSPGYVNILAASGRPEDSEQQPNVSHHKTLSDRVTGVARQTFPLSSVQCPLFSWHEVHCNDKLVHYCESGCSNDSCRDIIKEGRC